jgi:hypothetical protein
MLEVSRNFSFQRYKTQVKFALQQHNFDIYQIPIHVKVLEGAL